MAETEDFEAQTMDAAKKGLAESAAEGDLPVTTKAFNADVPKAGDFEVETTSRGEELKALAMVCEPDTG